MNALDRVIAYFSPKSAYQRQSWRKALSYYDATKRTKYRKYSDANPSGDGAVYNNTIALRAIARNLERNDDLARGVLTTLVNNTIGLGIGVEPHPLTLQGDVHDEFKRQIRLLFNDWMQKPEVTQELDWGMAQRLLGRRWFCDGESLIQHIGGNVAKLDHGTLVPYSIELLEADMLADYYTDQSKNIFQGVERSVWGRPTGYYFYKSNPGDFFIQPTAQEVKRVVAQNVSHIKVVERIRQARGVSIFASVITRLQDLKDYEESERVAAKVAASMAAFIKKGDPDIFQPQTLDDNGQRDMKFAPGMIFDDLRPGEDIGTIDTNRPNTELLSFRGAMLKAVSAGTGAGASSISKTYEGSYSSQRQEMVEQWLTYATLSAQFVSQCVRPVYQRFVAFAVLSGQLVVPKEVDQRTLLYANYIPPQMPWIDPLKEAAAYATMDANGYVAPQEIMRRRGADPDDVIKQRQAYERATEQGGGPHTVDKPSVETARAAIVESIRGVTHGS